jgi:thiamine pyrophosphokinase
VEVYGARGGRVDHEMSALHALCRFSPLFPPLTLALLSDGSRVRLLPAGASMLRTAGPERRGDKCGLVPLGGPVRRVTTRGLRWDLAGQALQLGRLVSTCNVIEADAVHVDASDPVLWVTSFGCGQWL